MTRKYFQKAGTLLLVFALLFVSGCSAGSGNTAGDRSTGQAENQDTVESPENIPEADLSDSSELTENDPADETEAAVLMYQGQASIRIITAEDKVIYIDPYAGDSYDLPADLILVTHSHFDHNAIDKIENRNSDCQIITWQEAIVDGEHQIFDLGYVTVEAVEAGYNRMHDVDECVGYVLTFSNGKSAYVTGDTSTTEQMPLLAEKEIDYAFFCCDGVYNMGLEEAARCAEMVGAKHNIPYHNTTSNTGDMFDMELAEQFDAPNRLIVAVGEEITVE